MTGRQPGYVPRILVMCSEAQSPSARFDQLTAAGWRVLAAHEVREAMAAIRADMADLVLVQLPVGEVYPMDLPRILREIAPLYHIPLVLLADNPTAAQQAEMLNGGADEVIAQATCPEEFVARINALLRIKELHDQLVLSRQDLERALDQERTLRTKLNRDKAELEELCTTDPLTHAQNIRSFRDILAHEFKVSARYDQPLTLIMLDIDHFKLVNDTCGHPVGDYVLKELTVILQQNVRKSDVVARMGGEEFAIILPKAGPRQAGRFAHRIRKEVAAHRFDAYGHRLRITVSSGWACYPANAEIDSPEMFVYLADQALLVAKETGRNRVVAYSQLPDNVRDHLVHQHNLSLHLSDLDAPSPAATASCCR
ncbi:MAG: diguanylate cyclase [Phycisphaerae bacterium]